MTMNNNDKSPQQDDRIRAVLTIYTTVQALVLILFFGVAPFARLKISSDESMGVVELILPIFTGYIGMMLGFYFGTKDAR
jgi:hypothetical protein